MLARTKQRDRILGLLLDARGAWVPLHQILATGCAQYSARIHEIRDKLGLNVENKISRDGSGHVLSWFRLVQCPALSSPTIGAPPPTPPLSIATTTDAPALFPDLKPSKYIDPEEVRR